MTTTPLTPAEHRAQAETDLAARNGFGPGTETYKSLTLSAIAHVLTAISHFLEPAPEPQVPGLPAGWGIATGQSEAGERKWRYKLAPPAGPFITSRYSWETSETALAAGIRYARGSIADAADLAGTDTWAGSGMDERALSDNGIRG
jgi:hypothetical protein